MPVADNQVRNIRGFPAGVVNRVPEHEVPDGALRKAINVDLSADGTVSRRPGYTQRVAARMHSLAAEPLWPHMLAVKDGVLVAYDDNLTETVIQAVADSPASAVQAGDFYWWTDGIDFLRIDIDDLSVRPVWTPCPGQCSATPYAAAGGLRAGRYQVALTWLDDTGAESGATQAVVVDVPEGGGIELAIPVNPDAAKTRVYMSPTNGDVLYFARDLPAAATSALVGSPPPGKALATQFLEQLPPGQLVRFWNGRLLVAAGNVLTWSEAMRYGLRHYDNTVTMRDTINLMQPVGAGEEGAGVYVDDGKRTYFMSGGDPKDWNRVIRYPFGAVPGTGITVPASAFPDIDYTGEAAFWLASNGVFCLGLPGGTVIPLTEKHLALPKFERGASMFRTNNGKRQVVTAASGGDTNEFAFSDSIVAEVRRHGVVVD